MAVEAYSEAVGVVFYLAVAAAAVAFLAAAGIGWVGGVKKGEKEIVMMG